MKNSIIIFLKNKIISFETIIPIIFELKENRNIIFVADNKNQLNEFKSNLFINEIINYLGEIILIGKSKNKYLNKITKIVFIFKLIILTFIYKIYIIHFGNLNNVFYKLLFYFNFKNTYYSQTAASGLKSLALINNPNKRRKNKHHMIAKNLLIYGKKTKEDQNIFIKSLLNNKNNFLKKRKFFFLNDTCNLFKWQSFLDRHFDYLKEKYNYLKKPYIVFFVSPFDTTFFLKNKNSVFVLFEKTIKELTSNSKLPIVIKLKDKAYDKYVLDIINKNNFNAIITRLNPSLLAKNASIFISNTPSNVFFIGKSNKIPTIEYSDYNEKFLKINNFSSAFTKYVDHFVNNEKDFRNTLLLCLKKSKKKYNYTKIDQKILD